ncbi:MAG: Uma2 family endonuclease [Trueperaceae bacterium]
MARSRPRGPAAQTSPLEPANARQSPGATVTAAAFLARWRYGERSTGARSELLHGREVARPAPDPACSGVLRRLERRLGRVVAREPRLAPGVSGPLTARARPLVRIGPHDVLRPELALIAAGGPTAAGLGGSFDAADVLLAVEAACADPRFDERLARYASAGMREVWLLELERGWVEALRAPWGGRYHSRTLWYPGEAVPVAGLWSVAVEALPGP